MRSKRIRCIWQVDPLGVVVEARLLLPGTNKMEKITAEDNFAVFHGDMFEFSDLLTVTVGTMLTNVTIHGKYLLDLRISPLVKSVYFRGPFCIVARIEKNQAKTLLLP